MSALVLLSNLLTHSRLKSARACKRHHKYRYLDGYRALLDLVELAFGDLIHKGLEAWWLAVKAGLPADEWLQRALAALRAVPAIDPYELAKAEVLLLGYHERWADTAGEYEVLGVEEAFEAPLINPATGAASTFWRLGGKLDVRVRRRSDGRRGFIEHKTSGEDVSLGSTYWKRLQLDGQVSIYFDGHAALAGELADFCLYDVIGKPSLRPLKATPVESRKYTKDGKLYAAQRAADETADEYRERCGLAIAEDPKRYFVRAEVQRLEEDLQEARFDNWQEAAVLRESIRAGRFPKNPEACGRCAFFDVCTGTASLDDRSRFTRTTNVHPELAGVSSSGQGSKEESPTP